MRTESERQSAEVGVIIGRFQVEELHSAHVDLIQKVIDTHPRVLVFLGLAPDICKCEYEDPLDFSARKHMFEETFPNVEVFYIKDRGNDDIWSSELDSQIKTHVGPGKKVLLYGGRDSFLKSYKGKYSTEELIPDRIISGTELRKNVGVKTKKNKDFRSGVIWAVENQWPTVRATVDGAILDLENLRTLLGRKTGEKKVRFIGGFANPESNSYEDDVLREVKEETGLDCINPTYLASQKIDDWRVRNHRNKIKTTFFSVTYTEGTPKADDDIAEIQWFNLLDLKEDDFIYEHQVLFRILKEKVIDKLKVSDLTKLTVK